MWKYIELVLNKDLFQANKKTTKNKKKNPLTLDWWNQKD